MFYNTTSGGTALVSTSNSDLETGFSLSKYRCPDCYEGNGEGSTLMHASLCVAQNGARLRHCKEWRLERLPFAHARSSKIVDTPAPCVRISLSGTDRSLW